MSYEIYPQIRQYLSSFLKLHKVLKRKRLTAGNVEWFANAIAIGAIKLAELQGQSQSLQNEILDKQYQKQELQRALQVINKRIVELAGIEKIHQLFSKEISFAFIVGSDNGLNLLVIHLGSA